MLKRTWCVAALLTACATLAVAQVRDFKPVTDEVLANPDPGDWLMLNRTFDQQRYSPLNQINKTNVGQLRMAWSRGLPAGTQESVPIVYRGIMYLFAPGASIQAVDAGLFSSATKRIRTVPVGTRCAAQETEHHQRPDRDRRRRETENERDTQGTTNTIEHWRQQIKHQQPPGAHVTVVQAFDADRETGHGQRDKNDGSDDKKNHIKSEKETKPGECDNQRDVGDGCDPVFGAIDAPLKTEQQ